MSSATCRAQVVFSFFLMSALLIICAIKNGSNRPQQEDQDTRNRLLRDSKQLQVENKEFRQSYVVLRGQKSYCFGTLIHRDVVLTAGQCAHVLNVGDSVSIWSFDATDNKNIESLTLHPKFDFPYYDFLLIKLDSPVENVSPIAINKVSYPSIGDNATSVRAIDVELGAIEELTLQVYGRGECQQRYQPPIINSLMICAGSRSNDEGNCMSDAGSPLINDYGLLIGVLSSRIGGCGKTSLPEIYSRVSWVSDWITSVLCTESSTPPASCATLEGREDKGEVRPVVPSEEKDTDETLTHDISSFFS